MLRTGVDSLLKDKPALPLQPAALRPLTSLSPGLLSTFICVCVGLLTFLSFYLYISHKAARPPGVNDRSALTLPKASVTASSAALAQPLAVLFPQPVAGQATQPSAGPTTPRQSQVVSQVYTLNQRFATALSAFSKAPVQNLHILSQSTADPAYNTPEKLLQYPAGAWEFTFRLDKAKGTFDYKEAMDGEELSLQKKSGVLWSDEGKGWRKVKASKFGQPPYAFSKVKSLDKLPFLYLNPPYSMSLQAAPKAIGPEGCDVVLITPPQPVKASSDSSSPEPPQEILFWITADSQPSLKAARYFWMSTPPGGTVYTVSQVDFN